MLSLILNTAYEISDIKKKKVYHSVYSMGVLFVLYWHGGSRTLYGEKVEGIQTILQSTHAVKTCMTCLTCKTYKSSMSSPHCQQCRHFQGAYMHSAPEPQMPAAQRAGKSLR